MKKLKIILIPVLVFLLCVTSEPSGQAVQTVASCLAPESKIGYDSESLQNRYFFDLLCSLWDGPSGGSVYEQKVIDLINDLKETPGRKNLSQIASRIDPVSVFVLDGCCYLKWRDGGSGVWLRFYPQRHKPADAITAADMNISGVEDRNASGAVSEVISEDTYLRMREAGKLLSETGSGSIPAFLALSGEVPRKDFFLLLNRVTLGDLKQKLSVETIPEAREILKEYEYLSYYARAVAAIATEKGPADLEKARDMLTDSFWGDPGYPKIMGAWFAQMIRDNEYRDPQEAIHMSERLMPVYEFAVKTGQYGTKEHLSYTKYLPAVIASNVVSRISDNRRSSGTRTAGEIAEENRELMNEIEDAGRFFPRSLMDELSFLPEKAREVKPYERVIDGGEIGDRIFDYAAYEISRLNRYLPMRTLTTPLYLINWLGAVVFIAQMKLMPVFYWVINFLAPFFDIGALIGLFAVLGSVFLGAIPILIFMMIWFVSAFYLAVPFVPLEQFILGITGRILLPFIAPGYAVYARLFKLPSLKKRLARNLNELQEALDLMPFDAGRPLGEQLPQSLLESIDPATMDIIKIADEGDEEQIFDLMEQLVSLSVPDEAVRETVFKYLENKISRKKGKNRTEEGSCAKIIDVSHPGSRAIERSM